MDCYPNKVKHLTKLPIWLTIFLTTASVTKQARADDLDSAIQNILQQRFAAGILLSDSDAVEFGIGSFDPNEIFNTDIDIIGNEQSLEERKSKSIYILPFNKEFSIQNSDNKHKLMMKAYAISSDIDVTLLSEELPKDALKETTIGLALGYGYVYSVNEQFSITPQISSHLMYYENDFKPNSDVSRLIEFFLDDRVFNVSAWANVYEPSLSFNYRQETNWGRWDLKSKWTYFYGYTWGDANNGNIGNPEGAYVTNEITGYFDILAQKQTLFLGTKRVDLSSTLNDELDTSHYYEISFGWLINRPTKWQWLDNIGIGINLNIDSSINGGSISLYYNKI